MISTGTTTNSPLEAALIGLWASVLGVTRIEPSQDFYALGGDASKLSTLLGDANRLFGVHLQAADFAIGQTTIPAMAQLIGRARNNADAMATSASSQGESIGNPVDRLRTYPLSATQRRMWFLAKLDPASSAYCQWRGSEINGVLDAHALQKSCELIVRRHTSLRTRYVMLEEEPRQQIIDDFTVDFAVVDLTRLPQASREQAAFDVLREEARVPLDFAAGQPLRVRLLKLGEQRHFLFQGMHHIAWDGWSAAVFERELSTAYAAFVRGEEPVLPVLPIQYADYALWQRQWLQGEVLERQLGYWKAKLQALGTLELPTDRPRPPVQSYRGARYALELPAALAQALKALGRREGATLFMTMLAAFKVLLYRYSAQEDIAVGTPIAARGRTELEGLIGFFANTLVLRTALDGNPSFRELLARVRETALGAYTHQDLPFEKLVEELAPARDLSRNPLFQVVLALQNMPGGRLTLSGTQVEALTLEGLNAKFDLMVSLRETPNGLRAGWEYASDLFDAATVERMAGHFQVLLEGIVADPSTPIAQLPLLSGAERQLLAQWNTTTATCPSACIHQLFEAQAARTPHAIAVRCEAQELTYAELNARANRLAHHLIALGVGPEALVGVCLERSLELVIALIAILKAGAAYVPLDPAYPNERLAFMLEDTHAPVLISTQCPLARLPEYPGKRICLDRERDTLDPYPDTNPSTRTTTDNLAYVIYTSGSTGKPKGVMVTHRNVTRLLSATHGWFGFDERDIWTCFHSCAFDFSVWEIWGALAYGGKLIVVPYVLSRDPRAFHALLRDERVTVLNQTPTAFQQLIAADACAAAKSDLALRLVIFGGEALDFNSLRPWYERHADDQPRLVNMYGITETTVHVTYRPIRRKDVERPCGSLIGVNIPDLRIYIFDRHRQPVPIGVPGELYVGGAGLARGYLNREELTAERFLPDPFVAGERIYRTGDLARYLPDGNIEYLGRIDDQVKIRGFRIEPGEIETVLAEHPSVRQAVVIAREDSPGDKRLVAYVVAAEPIEIEALRALVRERLPEYMRPGAYVPLEHLPLTPNGKIDRKTLPAPYNARDDTVGHFVGARNALEEAVAEVWREILHLEQVSIHDNFFDLGGHSLLAAQVAARLGKLLSIELPLRSMFESATIAELAEDISRMHRGSDEAALEEILREIEALTDDDAARELSAERTLDSARA